jgi:hypothetical protein
MILFILLGIIIFISVKNIREPYNTNGIILLGILSAFVGILATYLGVNVAFNSVPNINNISPHILSAGLKTALIIHPSLVASLCFFQRRSGIFLSNGTTYSLFNKIFSFS